MKCVVLKSFSFQGHSWEPGDTIEVGVLTPNGWPLTVGGAGTHIPVDHITPREFPGAAETRAMRHYVAAMRNDMQASADHLADVLGVPRAPVNIRQSFADHDPDRVAAAFVREIAIYKSDAVMAAERAATSPCEQCGAAYTDHARDCPTSPGGPPPMAAPTPAAPPAPGVQPPLVTSSPAMGVPAGGTSMIWPFPPGTRHGATGPATSPPKFDRRLIGVAVADLLYNAQNAGLIRPPFRWDVHKVVEEILEAIGRNL